MSNCIHMPQNWLKKAIVCYNRKNPFPAADPILSDPRQSKKKHFREHVYVCLLLAQ